MRYYFTSVTKAISKCTYSKCWRGGGEKGALLHYWWQCKLVRQYGDQQEVAQKSQNRATLLLGIYLAKTLIKKDTYTLC